MHLINVRNMDCIIRRFSLTLIVHQLGFVRFAVCRRWISDGTSRCVPVCVCGRVRNSYWRKVAAVSFTWFLFGRV